MEFTSKSLCILLAVNLFGQDCVKGEVVERYKDKFKEDIHSRQKRSTCIHDKYKHISSHTGCIAKSGSVITSGVSDADKAIILDLHNEKRNDVNPAATNMLKMSWDEEVALLAQKWADNCVFSHDGNYQRYIPGRFSVGQNLGLGHSSWTAVINGWHSEVNDFTFGTQTSKTVGHYTQMVWADSYKLGCGYASCTGVGKLYVCNYGPAGNNAATKFTPYDSGSSCSSCSSHCTDKLCDCGNTVCYNGGSVDRGSCQCTCQTKLYLYGDSCFLNCTGTVETFFCGQNAFIEANCGLYSNMPYDCPVLCSTCPHGGSYDVIDTETSTTSASGTTGSTASLSSSTITDSSVDSNSTVATVDNKAAANESSKLGVWIILLQWIVLQKTMFAW